METVKKLLAWIDSTGLSDLEFAQRAGVDNSMISKWRRTGTGNPRIDTVQKIKKTLNEFKIDNPEYNLVAEETFDYTDDVIKLSIARIDNMLQKIVQEQKKIMEIYEKSMLDHSN